MVISCLRLVFSLVVTSSALLALGCASGKSEEEISQEFEQFVSERDSCTETSDCVLAGGGCPLGCGSAVHSQYANEVNQKARQLIAEYEAAAPGCEYSCAESHAECQKGRCATVLDP